MVKKDNRNDKSSESKQEKALRQSARSLRVIVLLLFIPSALAGGFLILGGQILDGVAVFMTILLSAALLSGYANILDATSELLSHSRTQTEILKRTYSQSRKP